MEAKPAARQVAPAQVIEGTPIALSWRIRNNGDGATDAPQWQDAIYLSTNTTLDAGDLLLGLGDIGEGVLLLGGHVDRGGSHQARRGASDRAVLRRFPRSALRQGVGNRGGQGGCRGG